CGLPCFPRKTPGNGSLRALNDLLCLSKNRRPDPRTPIIRGREHLVSVWAEDGAVHPRGMSFQHSKLAAGCGIPQPRGVIVGGSEHALSVWAEDAAVHPTRMSFQHGKLGVGCGIPEPRGVISG